MALARHRTVPPISANSVTRQAVSAILTKRNATSIRSGDIGHPHAGVTSGQQRQTVGESLARRRRTQADTSARPWSSRPNQNRPPSSASRGSARIAASSSLTQPARRLARRLRPDSGEATILRTRSCAADGSPALATASATGQCRGSRATGHCRARSVPVSRSRSRWRSLASVASCAAYHPAGQPGHALSAACVARTHRGRRPSGSGHLSTVREYWSLPAALRSCREAGGSGSGVFDCAHRGGFEGAESLHESGTSALRRRAHRDAIGSWAPSEGATGGRRGCGSARA